MTGRAQVSASRGGGAEEEEPASSQVSAARAAEGAAKGRLVGAMMKKYLAEGMVPVLAELKRALEAARHPLLGDLLATLRALLREHKAEARTRDPWGSPQLDFPLLCRQVAPCLSDVG